MVVVWIALCASAAAAGGPSLEATHAYRLHLPNGWQRAPVQAYDQLSGPLGKALDKIPIDKDCVELLISPFDGETPPAVGQVIVKPRPEAKTLLDLAQRFESRSPPQWFQIQDRRDGRPMEVTRLEGHWRDLPGGREFVTDYCGSRAGARVSLRIWHVAWFAGAGEVHLSVFARADQFDKHLSEIEALAGGVKIVSSRKGWFVPVLCMVLGLGAWRRMRRRQVGQSGGSLPSTGE